jgi:hypothetical protein
LVRVGYVKPLRLLVRKRVGYVRPLRMGDPCESGLGSG